MCHKPQPSTYLQLILQLLSFCKVCLDLFRGRNSVIEFHIFKGLLYSYPKALSLGILLVESILLNPVHDVLRSPRAEEIHVCAMDSWPAGKS